MCVSKSASVYLLLVLSLQVNPGLDVTSRLLEGLSLGDLGRVMGADPNDISAQEDQHVGADLSARSCKEQTWQRGGEDNMSTYPKMWKCHNKRQPWILLALSGCNNSTIEHRKTTEGAKTWMRDCTRGQQEGTFKGFSMFQRRHVKSVSPDLCSTSAKTCFLFTESGIHSQRGKFTFCLSLFMRITCDLKYCVARSGLDFFRVKRCYINTLYYYQMLHSKGPSNLFFRRVCCMNSLVFLKKQTMKCNFSKKKQQTLVKQWKSDNIKEWMKFRYSIQLALHSQQPWQPSPVALTAFRLCVFISCDG